MIFNILFLYILSSTSSVGIQSPVQNTLFAIFFQSDSFISSLITSALLATFSGLQLSREIIDTNLQTIRDLPIDRKLTPGRYDFRGKVSCRSVLDKLEKADFVNIKVTIYEGAAIWAVASILARHMDVDSVEIIRLSNDSDFLQSMQLTTLEGYLFPETYFFPWGAQTKKMLSEMVAMYHQKTDKVWSETIPGGLSREEIIVLASIVEAEAQIEAEKPTIASVYHNRLKRRMKLDADPTVIYGLGGLDRPLNRRDLQRDTPYNTYMRKGLPVTAINSPGLSAIKAALHPAETDFLYFVADGSGGHRFARSNSEHNRNRQEIKRETANN